MRRKSCAEIESEFNVWIWKVHSLSIPSDRWAFDCVKTAVKFKNLKIVICIPPALGPFNYHIKGKCKCIYQFLINLTLSISIRQIFEVLKQRLIKKSVIQYFFCTIGLSSSFSWINRFKFHMRLINKFYF